MVWFAVVPDPDYFDPTEYEHPPVADLEWFAQHSNGNAALESGWIARSLSSVSDEPPVAPELALGLLYPGKRHVFSGPQESAKTLAAYLCGLEVVRSGRTIVLVDFEMGEYDAKRRMRELGATDDELEQISYVEPQSPATPIAIERLISREPALVIVDAAAGAFQVEGLDDNSRKDVEVWSSSWIAPFWRSKIATLVLDHVTKNAETRGNYAIGSERKVGGVDVHIGFQPVTPIRRGGEGLYKVTTHKDRGGFLQRGKLAELKLRSDPETHSLTHELVPWVETDGEEWFPYHIAENVSRYLELQSGAIPIGSVKENVRGKSERVLEAVAGLVREGFVEETEGSRGARMLELKMTFREAEFVTRSHPFPAFPGEGQSTRSPFPPSREERVGNDEGDGNGSGMGESGNGSEQDVIEF